MREKKLSFDTFPLLLQHMFLIKSSHCKFCAWLTYHIKFILANYIVGTPSCCGCALSIAHFCTGRFYPTLFCNWKFLVPGATIINRLHRSESISLMQAAHHSFLDSEPLGFLNQGPLEKWIEHPKFPMT